MTKEELYKLSLNNYHEYPLLAELMTIKDERFKDEQQDSMLCVNGYVGLDTLNNYVKLQQENQQLKIQISAREENYKKLEDNWNKLKEWVNKHYNYYMKNEDYIGGRLCFTDMKNKIKELEQGVSDVKD